MFNGRVRVINVINAPVLKPTSLKPNIDYVDQEITLNTKNGRFLSQTAMFK